MNETIDWITASADAATAKARPELASWLRRLPQGASLSTTDAATALGVSDETVRGWIEEGSLVAADLGKSGSHYYRIQREDLARFLSTRITTTAQK